MQRGLAPRVFEYIFKRISEEEDKAVSAATANVTQHADRLYMHAALHPEAHC